MDIISLLSAVGITGSIEVSDLKHLEDKDESDLVFLESEIFNTTGVKLSYTIPANKKLVIVGGRTAGEGTTCIAELQYANRKLVNFPVDMLRGYSLRGDGTRKMEIKIISISGNYKVLFFGYLINATTRTPSKPTHVSSIPVSPDVIKITFDSPLDNGGSPIIQYIVKKSNVIDDTYSLLVKTIEVSEGDLESNVTYLDESLADNTEYFYKIIAVNNIGNSKESDVTSATTSIDHPGIITNLVATPYNSTQNKLSFVLPTDTGGVPLVGVKITRSLLPDSGFASIVDNTNNLTTEYIDTGLDTNTLYYYKVYAINIDGKESLVPSNVSSATPIYSSPTNLIVQSTNNDTVAQLNWNAPVDTNSLPVSTTKIYRRLAGSGNFTLLGEVTGDDTTYDDNTVAGNKVYEYYIISVIDGEDTPQSQSSTVSIPIRPPTAPINVMAVTKSDDTVNLTWDNPIDDGGAPLTDNIMSYSESYSFTTSSRFFVGLVNAYSIVGLDADKLYYFTVESKNSLYNGAASSITNSTTFKTIFGESAEDITINDGETLTIGDKEYNNITNNGTIICTASIIRAESYDEGINGKILVDSTGCAGGTKGTTTPGNGGSGGHMVWNGSMYVRGSGNGGTSATKTDPTIAITCTDLDTMSRIIDDSLLIDTFEVQFKNDITGGKGSDGTPAENSGGGGSGGLSGTSAWNHSGRIEYWRGGAGGNGGQAANGVDGIRGNGKLAIYIRTITDKITIISKGNDGNNGIKGIAEQFAGIGPIHSSGDGHGVNDATSGQSGGALSQTGTLGSKGAQGGLVILVYESIPDVNNITVDVTGGLGGFGGQTASHADELTTLRADSGENGVFVSRTYQELLDSV